MVAISVVIPVYNSQDSIAKVVEELATTLPELAEQYEVILVEDSSPDDSWQVVEQVAQQYDWVRAFRLMRNYGQHNALLCGIRAARYAVTVTMDDDLQHPSEEIARLLAKLDEGFDVVYGSPQAEQHTLFRNLASQVTKWVLQGAMGADIARNISAFRIFRTHLRDAFKDYRGPSVNLDVLLTWGTSRFASVRVPHRPRTIGQSNYTFMKLVNHTFNMMTGFSTLPLRMASLLGFIMTAFGFALLFYIVVIRLLVLGYDLETVPGFTFLASVISIFAGAQMFTLGIIGEYLSRMHFRTMDKPAYIVREQVDDTLETAGTVQELGAP